MTDRELLDLEKLRAEIAKLTDDMHTEYARRYNWKEQEGFWRAQERVWQWQTWLLFGTFVLGVLGIISRVIWP